MQFLIIKFLHSPCTASFRPRQSTEGYVLKHPCLIYFYYCATDDSDILLPSVSYASMSSTSDVIPFIIRSTYYDLNITFSDT
jgi:hypothetical protein